MKFKSILLLLFLIVSVLQSASAMTHNMNSNPMTMSHSMQHETSMNMSSHNHMHGMYGPYAMTREASGTSWQPDSTPLQGVMIMTNNGMIMVQGFTNQVFDHQGGHRGDNKNFNESMLMFMAQKDLSKGTIGFRGMASLDPQMGPSGYPLLLQTGESANGRTPLIDRQHPHDLVMELAGTYSVTLAEKNSAFIYLALPGEPALGPPMFMMRWTGLDNPEAPIAHHWLDATHITYGVVTAGYVFHDAKIEISGFKGREPDQHRWDIESPKLDSASIRLSYNPTVNWSLQTSFGHIKSPEALEPNVNTNRTTCSVMYNRLFGLQNNWQSIFAWGRNVNLPGHTLDAFLFESAVNFNLTHTVFARLENVEKDKLFLEDSPLAHHVFRVSEFSLGYLYEFTTWHYAKPGLGLLMSTYALPSAIQPAYGHRPFSYMLFGRISLA